MVNVLPEDLFRSWSMPHQEMPRLRIRNYKGSEDLHSNTFFLYLFCFVLFSFGFPTPETDHLSFGTLCGGREVKS